MIITLYEILDYPKFVIIPYLIYNLLSHFRVILRAFIAGVSQTIFERIQVALKKQFNQSFFIGYWYITVLLNPSYE